jgi:hypothetical protein
MTFIVPIVEGYGEVTAVPVLLRRIAAEVGGWVDVGTPIRVSSGAFLNRDEERRRYVGLAANKARDRNGHVLVLLDCDQDVGGIRSACPAELGPRLLQQITHLRPDVTMFVALAHKEYESWFLAALPSLRGSNGIPPDAEPPSNPEARRDAKGAISQLIRRRYRHDDELQTRFTSIMSLTEARQAPSFARLYDWVAAVVQAGPIDPA